MSDLLKRIADYFTNDYQGDDKTAPTMEITVTDLRYIANMNVQRCRAEAELRNLTYNKRKDYVCEWKSARDGEFIQNPHTKRLFSNESSMQNVYCNTCGKKINIVGD